MLDFLLSLFLLFSRSFTVVQAQELKTDLVWQKDRLDEEITAVRTTYQSQLETYLYHEKLYRIAYDQNQQLQTLVSIEDVTQKGKNLGIYRDDVLLTYLDLLRLKLISTEGVELSLKENYLNRLEATITYLKNHQENLKNLSSREEIANSLAVFTAEQGGIGNLANEVQVLLSIGGIQAIYDKAVVLKQDIDNYLLAQDTADLPAMQRASLETGRSLDAAKLKLDSFWNDIVSRGQGNWYISKIYDELPRTLNPIYVNLSQSLSYLHELLSL